MLDDVRERLLGNAVQRGFDDRWKFLRDRGLHRYGQLPASRDTAREKFDGTDESEVFENRRSQLVREVAQTPLDLIEQTAYSADIRDLRRRQRSAQIGERQVYRCEQLARFVVKRRCDPFGLCFKHVVEAAERGV